MLNITFGLTCIERIARMVWSNFSGKWKWGFPKTCEKCDIYAEINSNFVPFRNSNSHEKPSNDSLRELEKRLALDIELYLFAKQRLLNVHQSIKK